MQITATAVTTTGRGGLPGTEYASQWTVPCVFDGSDAGLNSAMLMIL